MFPRRRWPSIVAVIGAAAFVLVGAVAPLWAQGREATPIPLTAAYKGTPSAEALAEVAPFASNYAGIGVDRVVPFSRVFGRIEAPITKTRPRPKDFRLYLELKIPVPSRPFALFADLGYRLDSAADGWLDFEFGGKLPLISRIRSTFESQRADVLSTYFRGVVSLGPKPTRKLDYESTLFGISYTHQRIDFSSAVPMGFGFNASLELGGAWKLESPTGKTTKSLEFRFMVEAIGVIGGPVIRAGLIGRLRHDGPEDLLGAVYIQAEMAVTPFVTIMARVTTPFQSFGAFDGAYQGFVTGERLFCAGVNVSFAP